MIPLLRLKTNITALRNKKHLPVAPLEISNHPQIFFLAFPLPLTFCVTHVGRLHVTPSHRAHRMASNTQLYSVSFTAFIEITDMQFFQTRALFSKFSQDEFLLVQPLAPSASYLARPATPPCSQQHVATWPVQVQVRKTWEKRSENSNFLAGIQEGLLTLPELQPFGS